MKISLSERAGAKIVTCAQPIVSVDDALALIAVCLENDTQLLLLDAGFAVSTGARFRIHSAPALRIATATLQVADAGRVADAVAQTLRPARRSLSA